MTYIKDLVSIIIPTYGRSVFLKNAIFSVLNQTYTSIEIIVVDDNGKDTINQINTKKIIEEFQCAKLHYEVLPTNRGGSYARNVGASIANGEYLCFLDDDDEFLPAKIEKQINSIKSDNKNAACYCSHIRKNLETGFQKEYIAECEGDIRIPIFKFLVDVCAGSSLMLYHHIFDKINGFTLDLPRFQDYEFIARLSFEGNISLVKEPLLIINSHQGSYRLKKYKEIKFARNRYIEIVLPFIRQFPMQIQNEILYINNFFLLKEAIRHYSLLNILLCIFKCSKYTNIINIINNLYIDIYSYIKKRQQ